MKCSVGCHLSYEVAAPTVILFAIEAAATSSQRILSETLTEPSGVAERWTMPESGNRYLRVQVMPGPYDIRYDAVVDIAPALIDPAEVDGLPAAALPLDTIAHLFPSRYCQSDKLVDLARAEFGGLAPGHSRVTAICNWINQSVAYRRGASTAETSALETVESGAGVCRDFAHLGIALCRALDIPARFLSAYAHGLQPPDFHGIFEAYLDGGWYLFDATRQAPLDRIVRIGVGRDAAEVSFATIWGDATMTSMAVWTEPAVDTMDLRTTSAVGISPQ